jgi:hypothetical protein
VANIYHRSGKSGEKEIQFKRIKSYCIKKSINELKKPQCINKKSQINLKKRIVLKKITIIKKNTHILCWATV